MVYMNLYAMPSIHHEQLVKESFKLIPLIYRHQHETRLNVNMREQSD